MNLRLALLLTSLVIACTESAQGVAGPVCPGCNPEVGGETGDLGGEVEACWGYVVRDPVDAAEATALGFDVAELERRVARSIDMPLGWAVPETRGGGAATGYDSITRVTARFSSRRSYRHVRSDPQYCDGTTCNFAGIVVAQDTCPRRLEAALEVQLTTADGAVEASMAGTAWSVIPGSDGLAASFSHLMFVSADTQLSAVHGKLRLDPAPGALGYRTSLSMGASLDVDAVEGAITPSVTLENPDGTITFYAPLHGSFPPAPVTGPLIPPEG